MGQYSWRDCVTGKPILDDVSKTSYVLVPREFGGGHIEEYRYDGYGNFGGYDIYELVLEWNKKYIPQYVKLMKAGKWECEPYTNDINDLMDYYNDQPVDVDLRDLGITLACYDEDNSRLKYPIKITYNPDVVYEECEPSPSDPDQGWGSPEPVDLMFSITFKVPEGKKLNKNKVVATINKLFYSAYVLGKLEVLVNDVSEVQDWYGDDDYDFCEVRLHTSMLEDDVDGIIEVIDDQFAAIGYTVEDVYWDYD